MLFLSDRSNFEVGKAIRGGIPVVFPQFGPGALPQHGFARSKKWLFKESTVNNESGDVLVIFTLSSDSDTLSIWPHAFQLRLTTILKIDALAQSLTVTNTGDSEFSFTSLLHNYFKVSSIGSTTVKGFQGAQYIDKTNKDNAHIAQTFDDIDFQAEVDRVYVNSGSRVIEISSSGQHAVLVLKTSGFTDFVVWNPGEVKAANMPDLGSANSTQFVCVEAGTVNKPIQLPPKSTWEGVQGITLKIPGIGQSA